MIPWEEPKGEYAAYMTDGPDKDIQFKHDGHVFKVEHTIDVGFDTGRNKYKVECLSCNKVLHENTTGPRAYIELHLNSIKKACQS